MFTRISSVLLLATIGGCGDAAPGSKPQRPIAEAAVTIPCAIGAGASIAPHCTVTRDDDPSLLVVRHPDGGFRRLQIVADGRGVIAADGAEPAAVRVLDAGMIEVEITQDRYRLPAHLATPLR